MSELQRAGQSGALDVSPDAAAFKQQAATVVDMLRQLGGNPSVVAGAGGAADPLNAPFTLYVDPYIGSDRFVGGAYNSHEATGTDEQIIAQKLKRIELQRLECGYTQARPFKTINRAIIEVGILTAKSYYESPLANNDLVTIVLMPGALDLLNGNGQASVTEWASGKEPTNTELQSFNTFATGGIVLPRGVSVVACFSDLRKTILRPSYVPPAADELVNGGNRRSIFKVTGTGYYWGMTFMDKVGHAESHHLLHCFEFASKGELDEFYGKIRQAFGGANNTGDINAAYAVTRPSEYEIVGPRPASGGQTIATDTTNSASPYILNCSIRSNQGLCGVYADGAKTSGFRSMVIAQFTGVSLQRDMTCWQRYSNGEWGPVSSYDQYITTDPDDVRMNPVRRSFHIRAINDAIIQEVSVFAIGQGIHHWVQNGGEITVTNSNSNFGGCAALAEGYKGTSFIGDKNWNIGTIRVATDLSQKRNNVRKIYLGTIDNTILNTTSTIKLTLPLEPSLTSPTQPAQLERDGYSLKENSYIWVENSRGDDYRVRLPDNAWTAVAPDIINIQTTFSTQDGVKPGDPIVNSQGYDTGQSWPSLAGSRIYIRRLQDTRSVDERRYSLRCNNTNSLSRTPLRDYVLQTTPGSGGIAEAIADNALVCVAAGASIATEGAGVVRSASVELRRVNPIKNWASNSLYRLGDCVSYLNKKWSCTLQNRDSAFTPSKWEQIYVHMESGFKAEDYWKNSQPAIVFDDDTDGEDGTTSCGYNLETVWATNSSIRAQYRSASDYRGIHSLLVSLGFNTADAHTILLPKTASTRERNPNIALDGINAPSGAANSWDNWPIEFRRPSNIRLFGHAWEWSGYLNYTKALPEYQQELSALNKFSYYFTNKDGGRVYGSGFNEEGYLVTPQGIQDLATGNAITFESLGDSDVAIDEIQFPAFYEQLAANELIVNTQLNLGSGVVKGTPIWEGGYGEVLPALPRTSSAAPGIIELATADEVKEFLRDDLAVTPATLIQALGDAIKSVVNLRVSLSSSSSVPSANQLNSTNIFIHPYNGNEIALYSTALLRWQVVRFSGVRTLSLAPCNLANTNYDIYLYNSGTTLNSTLAVEFTPWVNSTTPPTRGMQDGVIVRNNNPARRLIGVVRTTAAGTSTIDLGGEISGANSANFPKIYLSNLFNLYDCRAVYFFGSSWAQRTTEWATPPASVYATAPRVSWVQATETLTVAFLDIYNNWQQAHNAGEGSILYVAPGIDTTSGPPEDAFYGEVQYNNGTANSQWARALTHGKHDIYYLHKSFGDSVSLANEHTSHGMIVTIKA